MRASIVSEYRKFFSTRMWWVLTLVMVAYFLVVAFAMGWAFAYEFTQNSMTEMLDVMRPTVYGLGPSMGYVFPVIVGATAVTAEYRHNTILPTFIGEPHRWIVMVSKVIAAVPMGFVIGVAGTIACLAGGAVGLSVGGGETLLWTSTTLTNAALSVMTFTIWALVGVGLGMLITNQVGVIITVLAFTQLVEPLLAVALSMFSSTEAITNYLPGAAAGAAAGGTSIYSMMGMSQGSSLAIWQGALVLAAYGVVFGVLGYFLRIRRDVA